MLVTLGSPQKAAGHSASQVSTVEMMMIMDIVLKVIRIYFFLNRLLLPLLKLNYLKVNGKTWSLCYLTMLQTLITPISSKPPWRPSVLSANLWYVFFFYIFYVDEKKRFYWLLFTFFSILAFYLVNPMKFSLLLYKVLEKKNKSKYYHFFIFVCHWIYDNELINPPFFI